METISISFLSFSLLTFSLSFLVPLLTATDTEEIELQLFENETSYNPESGFPGDTPPDQLDMNIYRLHQEKGAYFRVGDTHVCGENMRFFAVPESDRLGKCDCDWFQCSRPLLYHETSKRCYWAWSQGPCKSGEWYTFGNAMLPICESTTCPISPVSEGNYQTYFFLRPEDGQCYEAGSRGYCEDEAEVLWIYPFQPIPQCRSSTVCYSMSVPASQYCIQGSRYHWESVTGDCSFF